VQLLKPVPSNGALSYGSIDSVAGKLFIVASENALHRIFFDKEVNPGFERICRMERTPLIIRAEQQLQEYFLAKRKRFDLPLFIKGTGFQEKVWNEIAKIPYGSLATYGDIAGNLGNRNLARAVGGAANRNPLPIIIPCHRVVGVGGKLVGFAPGVQLKQILINHERGEDVQNKSGSVDFIRQNGMLSST